MRQCTGTHKHWREGIQVLPVARWGAVIERILRATAAVSVGYCWRDTGRWVRGEFWGGSKVPRWGCTGPGEEKHVSQKHFSTHFKQCKCECNVMYSISFTEWKGNNYKVLAYFGWEACLGHVPSSFLRSITSTCGNTSWVRAKLAQLSFICNCIPGLKWMLYVCQ